MRRRRKKITSVTIILTMATTTESKSRNQQQNAARPWVDDKDQELYHCSPPESPAWLLPFGAAVIKPLVSRNLPAP